MTALAQARSATKRLAEDGAGHAGNIWPLLTNIKIWQGGLCVVDSAGYAKPGVVGTGLLCVGRAEWSYDTTGIASGTLKGDIREGTFNWGNSSAGDLITSAHVGMPCFIVDDQTVALTSATATRSPAGIVHRVDADGVWVKSSIEISRQLLNDASADAT